MSRFALAGIGGICVLWKHFSILFLFYRYMLQLKDDKVEEYFKKVTGLAQNAGCQVYIM